MKIQVDAYCADMSGQTVLCVQCSSGDQFNTYYFSDFPAYEPGLAADKAYRAKCIKDARAAFREGLKKPNK